MGGTRMGMKTALGLRWAAMQAGNRAGDRGNSEVWPSVSASAVGP